MKFFHYLSLIAMHVVVLGGIYIIQYYTYGLLIPKSWVIWRFYVRELVPLIVTIVIFLFLRWNGLLKFYTPYQ